MQDPETEDKNKRKYGIDESMKGQYAECDGGASMPVVLPNGEWGLMPSRETFKGVLTGVFFDQGDPPWRWFKMDNLTVRPEEVGTEDTVWCQEDFVWFADEE